MIGFINIHYECYINGDVPYTEKKTFSLSALIFCTQHFNQYFEVHKTTGELQQELRATTLHISADSTQNNSQHKCVRERTENG